MAQHRVIVLNGRRLHQVSNNGSDWNLVEKSEAKEIKPGIYYLLGVDAPKSPQKGVILCADRDLGVFQLVDNTIIQHKANAFAILPPVGDVVKIEYQGKQAFVEQERTNTVGVKKSRTLTR